MYCLGEKMLTHSFKHTASETRANLAVNAFNYILRQLHQKNTFCLSHKISNKINRGDHCLRVLLKQKCMVLNWNFFYLPCLQFENLTAQGFESKHCDVHTLWQ